MLKIKNFESFLKILEILGDKTIVLQFQGKFFFIKDKGENSYLGHNGSSPESEGT